LVVATAREEVVATEGRLPSTSFMVRRVLVEEEEEEEVAVEEVLDV
jgi:hypothetical protein